MAVYTEVTDEALTQFLALYDIGSLTAFRGIAEGVENSNYALKTSVGDFILTLYEKRVNKEDLPYFLALMEHLRTKGLHCPLPVRARDGRNLQELSGRMAAITTFLPGVWPRQIKQAHCEPLGAALARLHLAGEGFAMTRQNGLGPAAWPALLEKSIPEADNVLAGLGAELQGRMQEILVAWPQNLPQGQIHADLFPDNVFFLNDNISGVIDFYFACTDILAYDIAVCLNSWCFENNSELNITRSKALLRGYQSVRPLSDAEIQALPVLCRGAAMRFLVTRLYDWLHTPPGAFVTPKDPLDYYKRLRFHFSVSGASAYGL